MSISEYTRELKKYRTIVNNSYDAIVSLDVNGNISSWNKAAEKILGYKEQESLGQSLKMLSFGDSEKELMETLECLRNDISVVEKEWISLKKDGTPVNLSITMSPIKDDKGIFTGIAATARDITKQKLLEEELRKLDTFNVIGEMAASISHEIRNPMTTVRGFLQILSEKPGTESYKEYFSLMIDELDRANSIITEFLSLSRIKTADFSSADLNSLIYKIVPLLQADAISQNKEIKVISEEIPLLQLNEREIRQLVLNLTRNGLESMEDGGILTIHIYKEGEDVVLAISDQGKGIPDDIINNLGKPFVTSKPNGTGLGLAVCFGIVKRHQATIDVKTSPNGTTFFVRFKEVNMG